MCDCRHLCLPYWSFRCGSGAPLTTNFVAQNFLATPLHVVGKNPGFVPVMSPKPTNLAVTRLHSFCARNLNPFRRVQEQLMLSTDIDTGLLPHKLDICVLKWHAFFSKQVFFWYAKTKNFQINWPCLIMCETDLLFHMHWDWKKTFSYYLTHRQL